MRPLHLEKKDDAGKHWRKPARELEAVVASGGCRALKCAEWERCARTILQLAAFNTLSVLRCRPADPRQTTPCSSGLIGRFPRRHGSSPPGRCKMGCLSCQTLPTH